MATGAAGDGIFRCVFDCCISGVDNVIERRPYHRNCGCALHKSRKKCSHSGRSGMNVSYPIRRSWSEGCLALVASAGASSSGCSSPSTSSPAVAVLDLGRNHNRLGLFNEEDEEDCVSVKV